MTEQNSLTFGGLVHKSTMIFGLSGCDLPSIKVVLLGIIVCNFVQSKGSFMNKSLNVS